MRFDFGPSAKLGLRSARSFSGEITMKMIIIIVKDHDADMLTTAFTAGDFRVTRVASTGGFLRSGVVTLLLGVEDEQVDSAIQVVRSTLQPLATGEKRATLFVVPVQRFEQV
jgi:uncharacterized protein YaaQ